MTSQAQTIATKDGARSAKVIASVIKSVAWDCKATSTKAFVAQVYWTGNFAARYGWSMDAFKAILWTLHTSNLIELSRCNMVEAFERHPLAESRIEYLGAVFELIYA